MHMGCNAILETQIKTEEMIGSRAVIPAVEPIIPNRTKLTASHYASVLIQIIRQFGARGPAPCALIVFRALQ